MCPDSYAAVSYIAELKARVAELEAAIAAERVVATNEVKLAEAMRVRAEDAERRVAELEAENRKLRGLIEEYIREAK